MISPSSQAERVVVRRFGSLPYCHPTDCAGDCSSPAGQVRASGGECLVGREADRRSSRCLVVTGYQLSDERAGSDGISALADSVEHRAEADGAVGVGAVDGVAFEG